MPRQRVSKFWQTARFREVQRLWEEKLKASGFIDAERNGKLYQNAANSYRTQILTVIENRQRYYELLGQGHHEEDFSCGIEKYVMQRRSEGVSIRQISEELKVAKKKGRKETIRKIIRFYEAKWRIKKKTL